MTTRPSILLALIGLAIVASLAIWQLREQSTPRIQDTARSDYVLNNYELVSLDSDGKEAFTVKGPYLERDPSGKSLTLRTPQFSFPDEKGGHWLTTSDIAWVADKGTEVRLIDHVVMVGPITPNGDRTHFNTEHLQVFPKKNLVQSDDPVTISQTASILQGRGLRVDMQARRFQLLANVKGHYAPQSR